MPVELMHFNPATIYEVEMDEELRDDFELLTAYMMLPIKHMLNYGGSEKFKIACGYSDMERIDGMFDEGELKWTPLREAHGLA